MTTLTALIYAAGAVAVASILAGTAVACALLASRRPAERFDQHARQALAVTQPPAVARTAPAPARGAGPGVPPPGPWPHRTPLIKRIDVLECGCTWIWDGRARTWEHVPCSPPPATDWDAEMKSLTQ